MTSTKIPMTILTLTLFILGGGTFFGAALDNGFYYDDLHQIVENPFIRDVGIIPELFSDIALSSRNPVFEGYHYRPLLLSTFVLNYAWGGILPFGYHLLNLFFHVGSSFLVFLILSRLLSSRVDTVSRGVSTPDVPTLLPGVAAGAVMLLHPVNAEVVNYVTARSSVMATFFYLLSCYAYLRAYQEAPRPGRAGTSSARPVYSGNKSKGLWIGVALLAFTGGLLTKEIMVTLPGMLLLYEFVLASQRVSEWRRVALRIAPYLALSLGYLILRKLLAGMIGSPVEIRELGTHLLVQVKALAVSWQLLLFPVNLSIVHDLSEPRSFFEGGVIGSMLLFIGILIVMLWSVRSSRHEFRIVGFSLAWFYITLLPTTIIPLKAVVQENRLYIAAVAFAFLIGILFSWVDRWKTVRVRQAACVGLGLLLMAYAIGVIDRNRVWNSELNLWQDAVRKAPDSDLSHGLLGIAYQKLGWYDEAEAEMKKAIALNGTLAELHSNLGGVYMYQKREDLAEREYMEAIRLNPNFDRAHTNLGILYRRQGDLDGAMRELEAALRIYPFSELTLYNLSQVYRQAEQPDKALSLLTHVLEKNPNLPRIQRIVGLFYQERGDREAARRAFDRAFRMDPSLRDETVEPR